MPDQSKRPTLQDVARLAHVSIATASVALSGGRGVAAETREAVTQAAQALGYRANARAKGLRSQHRPLVGLCLDPALQEGALDSAMVLVRRLLSGIPADLDKGGAGTVLLNSWQADPGIDGLIVVQLTPNLYPDIVTGFGVPILRTGIVRESEQANARVRVDFARMVRDAMDHLVATGHQRPALVVPVGDAGHLAIFEKAYEQWCAARGIPASVTRFDASASDLDRAADEVLTHEPDAVFLATGRAEGQLTAAIRRAGRQRGQTPDIMVFGEGVVEEMLDPPVSYVALDGIHSAQVVASAMLGLLAGSAVVDQDLHWRIVDPEA